MTTQNVSYSMVALVAKLRHLVYVLVERFQDWRLGVTTEGDIYLKDLGIGDTDCHCYGATGYRRFKQLMEHVSIVPGEDRFIDYGSGLGRVVILAARYPFKQVLGLEVSERLHEQAIKNIATAKSTFVCQDVQLINADARTFPIPPSATVFYFWNPFSENILRVVLDALHDSLKASPRKVTLCYASPYTPNCLENLLADYPWLAQRETFSLGSRMRVTIAVADQRRPVGTA